MVGGNENLKFTRLIGTTNFDKTFSSLLKFINHIAIYRQAVLVLLPSAGEGFGLPVIEAMACGALVVASDLPVLREVGGPAAVYCPVGLVSSWTETIAELIGERSTQPQQWSRRRAAGLAQAANFSWSEYARQMAAVYRQVL